MWRFQPPHPLGSNHEKPLEALYTSGNDPDTQFPISIVYRGEDTVGVSLVGDMNWAWTPSLCVARRLLGTPATPAGRGKLRAWIARTSRAIRALEVTWMNDDGRSDAATTTTTSLEDTRHFTTFALKAACMELLAQKIFLEAETLHGVPVEIECTPVDRDLVPGWTPAQEARGMMIFVPVPLFLYDPRDAVVAWEYTDPRDAAPPLTHVGQGLDFLELRVRGDAGSTRRRRFLRAQCRRQENGSVRVNVEPVLGELHRIVVACLETGNDHENGDE